jgi:hypothetical protein
MKFVESEDEEVLQMLAYKDEKIKKAYTVLTTISQDEKERHEYESREMQLYDEISRLEDARYESRKETAIEILRDGEPLEKIEKYSKLSREQIEKLSKEIKVSPL